MKIKEHNNENKLWKIVRLINIIIKTTLVFNVLVQLTNVRA